MCIMSYKTDIFFEPLNDSPKLQTDKNIYYGIDLNNLLSAEIYSISQYHKTLLCSAAS